MKALFFDTEWANSKNKSICQLAFLEVDLDTLEVLNEFNEYINPVDSYDRYCIATHHITNKQTDSCDTFDVVWNKIKCYFENNIIIGHNICSADLDALVKNLNRYGFVIPKFKCIDTYDIARDLINPINIDNYKLSTIAEYFDCQCGISHDAYNDVLTDYNAYKEFMTMDEFCCNKYLKDYSIINGFSFNQFGSKKEFMQELNALSGIVHGMEMDKAINLDEINYLIGWKERHCKQAEAVKLIELLDSILEDGYVTLDEIESFRQLASTEIASYGTCKETRALNYLHGIIDGITSDNEINFDELHELQTWMYENQYLEGNYPYDKILKTINEVLEDGIISKEEKEKLITVFDEFFHPIECLKKQIIEYKDKNFVLSGNFVYGSKADVANYIINKGGIIQNGVTKKTDYVVVGGLGSGEYAHGSYGSKVKKAIELSKIILKEEDIFEKNNEQDLEQTIYNEIIKILRDESLCDELTYSSANYGLGYYVYSNVLLRINTSLKSKNRIEFLNNAELIDCFPTSINVVQKEVKENNLLIYQIDLDKDDKLLLETLSLLKPAIKKQADFIYENHTPDLTFGCCGKYMECSDAKECLQKYVDKDYAKGCQYRVNLEAGRIFYGKNRNI